MNYSVYKKNELKKLEISDISTPIPSLKDANKTSVLSKWLMDWIDTENIENCLLPTKQEFAYFFSISLGTVQNIFKILEDNNYIFLKQRIGAIIKPKGITFDIRKQTSKSDVALLSLKDYIKKSDLNNGDKMLSTRKIAKILGCSLSVARVSVNKLIAIGILEKTGGKVVLKNKAFEIEKEIVSETLVNKVKEDLKYYIAKNFKIGEKIPSHQELAEMLKVSVKTIHNSIKLLENDGVLVVKRGTYGTIVARNVNSSKFDSRPEMSIFAPAIDTAFYHYEKTQNKIKKIIAENYNIGSKLPSINELSVQLDLSPNTIRKAFNNLSKEGILRCARGRYGGTFVIDIPNVEEQTFRWLAVNPQYAKSVK